MIDDALISLTWHADTETKRASASYPLPGGDTDLPQYNQLSDNYPGRIFAFEVPDPDNPRRKRLAVGRGVTLEESGVGRASMMVVTKGCIGAYPVTEAEDEPITNVSVPPWITNGTSG